MNETMGWWEAWALGTAVLLVLYRLMLLWQAWVDWRVVQTHHIGNGRRVLATEMRYVHELRLVADTMLVVVLVVAGMEPNPPTVSVWAWVARACVAGVPTFLLGAAMREAILRRKLLRHMRPVQADPDPFGEEA